MHLFFPTLSTFQLILTNFETIGETIRTLLFLLSVCVCPPSVEMLQYERLSSVLSYVKVRTYTCMHTCIRWFDYFFFGVHVRRACCSEL